MSVSQWIQQGFEKRFRSFIGFFKDKENIPLLVFFAWTIDIFVFIALDWRNLLSINTAPYIYVDVDMQNLFWWNFAISTVLLIICLILWRLNGRYQTYKKEVSAKNEQ